MFDIDGYKPIFFEHNEPLWRIYTRKEGGDKRKPVSQFFSTENFEEKTITDELMEESWLKLTSRIEDMKRVTPKATIYVGTRKSDKNDNLHETPITWGYNSPTPSVSIGNVNDNYNVNMGNIGSLLAQQKDTLTSYFQTEMARSMETFKLETENKNLRAQLETATAPPIGNVVVETLIGKLDKVFDLAFAYMMKKQAAKVPIAMAGGGKQLAVSPTKTEVKQQMKPQSAPKKGLDFNFIMEGVTGIAELNKCSVEQAISDNYEIQAVAVDLFPDHTPHELMKLFLGFIQANPEMKETLLEQMQPQNEDTN